MMKSKKKRWKALFLAAAAGACLLAYNVIRASGGAYDYFHLLSEFRWEEGLPFQAVETGSGGIQTAGTQAGADGSAAQLPDGMQPAAATEELILLTDPKTAGIAVYDRRNGQLWYAAPENYQNDAHANKSEKNRMASVLSVTWYDSQYRENSFYSWPDSVEKQQFEIRSIENGIRIVYTMGEKGGAAEIVPKYITAERMEERILSKLNESDRKYIQKRYVESSAKKGFLELPAKSMTSEVIMKKLQEILVNAGYTKEDLAYENESSGYETELTRPYAVIPVEYTISGASLSVRIPLQKAEWEESIRLKGIELFNYFGAGGNSDDGYLFVPSGSGALISFNNGKTAENPYSQNVYGTDPLLLPNTQMQSQQTVRLPVFGLKNNDAAWFASIEEGAAFASVSADIAGRKNSYNNVYSSFLFVSADSLMVNDTDGGGAQMKLLESETYSGDIRVDYHFLSGEDADYSGMARYYRQKLIDGGELKRKEDGGNPETLSAPFYLDILGSIQKSEYFAGIPYKAVVTLTDTDQAEQILNELAARGISEVVMRYMGWFNRGVNHDSPKTISLDSGVGKEKDWERLEQKLKGAGGSLYPDAAFWYLPWNSRGLNEAREAARLITGQSASISPYNPASLRMSGVSDNGVFYLTSPNALPGLVDGFLRDYKKLPQENVSLRDLGDVLVSDKGKKRYMDRETAMLAAQEQLEKIEASGAGIMLAGGNQYALACADHVIDVPTGADRFYIIDEEIPFYEMVLRGSAGYAGTSLNLNEVYDRQQYLLNMLECGGAPHFTWTFEDTEKLSMTPFNSFYSTDYRNWLDDADYLYEAAKQLWDAVNKEEIVEHRILQNGVRAIRYVNGVVVYVNYEEVPQTADGIAVGPRSYVIRKAGEVG